ncbi:U32 family peptidase [Candidatus Woesearchaeota archaeon]|nr:U32 family peptidase [Candidatus Woesearchaeota archaeon]
MTELLAPVGNWIMLEAAIQAGADSVYLGIKGTNMRARAQNFELKDLEKITQHAHKNKVKVYLTVNTIVYDNEIKKIKEILKVAKKAKVDAVICWDLAVIQEAKKLKLPIHISTQASISNFEALKFYYKLGARRFILARELSLEQIKEIKKKIKQNKLKAEIEVFIHGAMCVSISGRCFMSQFSFNKSANRGECWQPCRREYLIKDKENEIEFKLGHNYILSPKDLCTIEFIDKLINAGIDCFKIEGRNRSPEYVKTVVSAYRKVINSPKNKNLIKQQLEKLKTVYNKGFSTGFFLGKPINQWSDQYGSKATETKKYLGKVLNYYNKSQVAEILLEAGSLKIGDKIMIQGNKTGVIEQKITSMEINKKKVKIASKGKRIGLKTKKARENDKVYKIVRKSS